MHQSDVDHIAAIADAAKPTPPTEEEIRVSPWMPERDPVRAAVLGKLLEETGELTAILARCSIQGLEESDPDTGTPNRDALQDEMADVLAGIETAVRHCGFHRGAMFVRQVTKEERIARWHDMIRPRKGAREHLLEEAAQAIDHFVIGDDDAMQAIWGKTVAELRLLATTETAVAQGYDTWHDDDRDVLWWLFPICEAPYVGSPLSSDWPFADVDLPRLRWTRFVVPVQP